MKCGRGAGDGSIITGRDVCPAATDKSYDGINSGTCAGRFCWAVCGTMCGGSVQGTFAEKRDSCVQCNFYLRVQAEQGTVNLRTKFLRFVNPDIKGSLFDGSTYKYIKQGERFFSQGEAGDTAFIIHRGACVELVEKEGDLHLVGHRSEGDIVGMLSVLTGEPRHVHVEAETDMEVWVIDKAKFDQISQDDPDLLVFLTELVSDRFDSSRPTADRTIGKYTATHIIGRGGYSIVYKGVHNTLNMPVAIKMMRHNLAMRTDFLENFRNEAKIIASLNHDHIIRVLDIEERYRTVFIMTEYLEGESLSDMLKRLGTISPLLSADYIIQVCSALVYAGQKGLIHRDINPSNIFVVGNDRIKLIDFGLACPPGTDDQYFGGAFYYLAPELFEGEPADERSDIYALGMVAYELITGERPFPELDPIKFMKIVRNEEIPDPCNKTKQIPPVFRNFILKACKKNPSERYQSASDVIDDLLLLFIRQKNDSPVQNSSDHGETRALTLYIPTGCVDEFNSLLDEFTKKVKEFGGSVDIES